MQRVSLFSVPPLLVKTRSRREKLNGEPKISSSRFLKQQVKLLQALHLLSDAVVRSVKSEEIYQLALKGLQQALRSSKASILLFDEDNVMRFKAWLGLSQEYRKKTEGHSPWVATVRNPKPILVADVKKEESLKPLRDVILKEGIQALAFIPLVCKKKLLGKFMVYYGQTHTFTEEEMRLALIFASHIAFAIERKQAEEKLRLYHRIFSSSIDGIGIIDPQGFYIEQNSSHRRLIGYSEKEIRQKTPALHMGQEMFSQIAKTLAEQGSFRGEVPIQTKSGKPLFVDLSAFAVKNEEGRPAYYVGIKRDITLKKQEEEQRKQTEKALRESKKELEVILQGVADGITAQDSSGKLVYANTAAILMSGFSSLREMKKASSQILKKFELRDEHGQPFPQERLPGRRALNGELMPEELINFRQLNSGEERWSIVKARPIFDENGKVRFAINIIHDITQRKELEKRKDDFISIASHELKTPVTSIKAFTQLLQKRFKQSADHKASYYLSKMSSQMDKLLALISDLLDVSKIQAGKLELHRQRFDFDALVEEVIEEFRITMGSQIVKYGLARQNAFADRDRIGQVLNNFISNAIKYSPSSKKVVIRVRKNTQDISVSVQDFGIGISKENQKRIFERFFRVKGSKGETFPGLGVGLSISSEMIKRHKGKIWVDSEEGKGSTFYFSLPYML